MEGGDGDDPITYPPPRARSPPLHLRGGQSICGPLPQRRQVGGAEGLRQELRLGLSKQARVHPLQLGASRRQRSGVHLGTEAVEHLKGKGARDIGGEGQR